MGKYDSPIKDKLLELHDLVSYFFFSKSIDEKFINIKEFNMQKAIYKVYLKIKRNITLILL